MARHHQHLALQEEEGHHGQHVAHVQALKEPLEAQVEEGEACVYVGWCWCWGCLFLEAVWS